MHYFAIKRHYSLDCTHVNSPDHIRPINNNKSRLFSRWPMFYWKPRHRLCLWVFQANFQLNRGSQLQGDHELLPCWNTWVHTCFYWSYLIHVLVRTSVRHTSVLWNCVRLCYICNEKPYTDRTKSSLCFIPSSDFIIGDNCKGGHYFTADTI